MASGHEIPQPNFAELEEFLELLQGVTSGLEGKVIIASFGQNPSSSENLNPLIRHFEPSPELAQKILAFVTEHLSEPHRNFYFCGSTMRTDLPWGKKGKEEDIERVFLLVADFDAKNDSQSEKFAERLPPNLPPQLVIETSPESFQTYYIFDKPRGFSEAKNVAKGLVKFCECDPVSQDLSHVWRLPGLPNWPNKKKIEAGRSPIPFIARVVKSAN